MYAAFLKPAFQLPPKYGLFLGAWLFLCSHKNSPLPGTREIDLEEWVATPTEYTVRARARGGGALRLWLRSRSRLRLCPLLRLCVCCMLLVGQRGAQQPAGGWDGVHELGHCWGRA
jgi:hypothetical protein